MAPPVVVLEDVHKRYRIYRRRYQSLKEILVHQRLGEWQDQWALRGVSLEVARGTSLGLIGPNGAGKSTALKLMARILRPDRGRVSVTGRVAGLLELGAGFQIDYTGRENIYLNASLFGLTRRDIDRRFDSIVEFSELEHAIDDPIRTYSSGMHMRLAFSIAVHVDPEVLLVDEILAVGDESFQQKCLRRIRNFQAEGGTIVYVSHGLSSVQEMCTEAAWIESGEVRKIGTPDSVVEAYLDRVREHDTMIEQQEGLRSERKVPAVQLGEARLLDRNGRRAGVIEMGDPLTVEIPFHVKRSLAAPVFSVSIFRNDGAHVFTTNSRTDIVPGPLDQDGKVRVQFRSLPLVAGTYRLSVGLYASSESWALVDTQHWAYGFRVLGSVDEQGLVHLDHEWAAGDGGAEQGGRRQVS
ncbi:MAG: ABC transporter ATP-binding protein [Acidimicrobiaceae bacterium]|nr:ABC transporter ATP-binding protein [Acidimicrobiaceae bacterium]